MNFPGAQSAHVDLPVTICPATQILFAALIVMHLVTSLTRPLFMSHAVHTSEEGSATSVGRQSTHVPFEVSFRLPPPHAEQKTAASSRTRPVAHFVHSDALKLIPVTVSNAHAVHAVE